MTSQTKFIIAAIAFLIPVGVYLLQWVFFMLGKIVFNFTFPKLKRSSKLRFYLIEFSHNSGGYDLLYTLTGCATLYLIFVVISIISFFL